MSEPPTNSAAPIAEHDAGPAEKPIEDVVSSGALAGAVKFAPGDLLARQITMLESVRSAESLKPVTLEAFLDDVRSLQWITAVTRIRSESDDKAVQRLKCRLPAAKISGHFKGLAADDIITHSGLLAVDVDHVPDSVRGAVRDALIADHHTLAVFRSPTVGLKVIVPVLASTAAEHKSCAQAAVRHFGQVLGAFQCEVDSHPTNVASNTFVSADRDLRVASTPVEAFRPDTHGDGCDIDCATVIQSNEKEFPPPSRHAAERSANGSLKEPPGSATLPTPRLNALYGGWMAHMPYKARARNSTLVKRAPILINVVAPDVARLFLLHWFDLAPPGLFKSTRSQHWREVCAAVANCVDSWESEQGLNSAEIRAFAGLRSERDRNAFRIVHSLSLCKENVAQRAPVVAAHELGCRLGVPHSSASSIGDRVIKHLVRAGVIELLQAGEQWEPGRRPKGARYRWLLAHGGSAPTPPSTLPARGAT